MTVTVSVRPEVRALISSFTDELLVADMESAIADDDRESIRMYAPELLRRFRSVDAALLRSRNFEALKALRGLFALEDKELQPLADTPSAA